MSVKAIFVTWEPKQALDGMMQLDPWEELAYRRILDMIYVSGNKLEDSDKKLAWSTKTGNRWRAIRKTLFGGDEPKLYVKDGYVRNKKCDEKLVIIETKVEQKSIAGKASAKKRKALKDKETGSTPVDDVLDKNTSKTSTDGQLNHLTIEEEERRYPDGYPRKSDVDDLCDIPKHLRREPEPKPEKPKSKRGSRLPDDWTLPKDLAAWAEAEGMSTDRVRRVVLDFHDYWIAKSGKDATKTDWAATWRRWVRKDLDGNRGGNRQGGGRNGGQADAINDAFNDAAQKIREGQR